MVEAAVRQAAIVDDIGDMARQQLAQGSVHQRGDLAGLLEAHPDRCTEMHVDLAGLDTGEEILPKPGDQQAHRGECRREKCEDESAATRNRLF